MAIDPREFRDALGTFATGVTIITTRDEDGDPVGLTANSFTSLSLDPPLVLFCLDRKVRSFEAVHDSRHFAVNILCSDQRELSSQFARSGPDKWNGVEFETWETGVPILKGCTTSLECDLESVFEGGDHVIVVGRVRGMTTNGADSSPLLFYRGRYGELAVD